MTHAHHRATQIPSGPVTLQVELPAELTVPSDAAGVVLFAHGSGSSRLSPRNRFVADVLVAAGFGTLLFDLLTETEATLRTNVFDIELLVRRLLDADTWLRDEIAGTLPIGYFGASTGAAAALAAAAQRGDGVGAVVSRGGRPDLAGAALGRVTSPTLLIVGSLDPVVLDLNQQAVAEMTCEAELAVVHGAGHLFEQPGTLAKAADLAAQWFGRCLTSG